MRHLHALAILVAALAATTPAVAAAACPPLLDHRFPRLQDGAPQSLCQFHGKVLLVVNTASFCGNTPQYEGLEALHEKYGPRGLVVVGFPSNDFGNQEPGSEAEIADFCRLTYGIRFPMLGKTDIAPPRTHPFFRALAARTGAAPRWNFHKYLIDRRGEVVRSFDSQTKPDHRDLVAAVEKALAAP